jgi:hypothetical protein
LFRKIRFRSYWAIQDINKRGNRLGSMRCHNCLGASRILTLISCVGGDSGGDVQERRQTLASRGPYVAHGQGSHGDAAKRDMCFSVVSCLTETTSPQRTEKNTQNGENTADDSNERVNLPEPAELLIEEARQFADSSMIP